MEDRDFGSSFEELEDNTDRYSRLDTEWTTLVALHDVIGIVNKGARNRSVSYNQALSLGEKLIPELFNPENSLLNKPKLSETARRFTQIAQARSELKQKPVSPIDLLEAEIDE